MLLASVVRGNVSPPRRRSGYCAELLRRLSGETVPAQNHCTASAAKRFLRNLEADLIGGVLFGSGGDAVGNVRPAGSKDVLASTGVVGNVLHN